MVSLDRTRANEDANTVVECGNSWYCWERGIALAYKRGPFSNIPMIHMSVVPHLISATLEPPLPMMQPMSSLGTVISWLCCPLGLRVWPAPVSSARAATLHSQVRLAVMFDRIWEWEEAPLKCFRSKMCPLEKSQKCYWCYVTFHDWQYCWERQGGS